MKKDVQMSNFSQATIPYTDNGMSQLNLDNTEGGNSVLKVVTNSYNVHCFTRLTTATWTAASPAAAIIRAITSTIIVICIIGSHDD